MALQVCEYPKCKTITILPFCEEHADVETEEEELDEVEASTDDAEPEPTRPTEEDLVASVMNVVRNHPAVQKKEPTMTGKTCTKKGCEEDAADNSVMCAHHRDQKKRSNENYQNGTTADQPKPKRSYTKRKPKGESHEPVKPEPVQLPARRAHAPIELADPLIVNPQANGHHAGLPAIYELIVQYETELATLRHAKEILERHA